MSRQTVVAAIVAIGIAREVPAQSTHTDSLFITGRADHVVENIGGEAGVQWLRTIDGDAGFEAGGSGGSIAGSSWLAARVGGHRRWRTMTVSATVDVGRAHDSQHGFNYGGPKAGIAIPLARTVFVEMHAQHITLPYHASHQLYQSSISWYVRPSLSLQGGYYLLSAGRDRAHLTSGRLDASAGGVVWILGAVVGPVRDVNPLAVQLQLTPPSRDFFGGCRFQIGRYEVSSVLNLTQSTVLATRMLVGVRIPLR